MLKSQQLYVENDDLFKRIVTKSLFVNESWIYSGSHVRCSAEDPVGE